ncbi:uncharacterized protein RSE6_11362 [Rhynchosporium secalis]|uniref:Uncharacterized protein n=1 Tax=Rhynchosporium secalis TaxID=38038 RepID=A0A1E1MMT2_RHYSE|nr:uncharacterized protein RSE6_11362 [Rhynchosporium secalis]
MSVGQSPWFLISLISDNLIYIIDLSTTPYVLLTNDILASGAVFQKIHGPIGLLLVPSQRIISVKEATDSAIAIISLTTLSDKIY